MATVTPEEVIAGFRLFDETVTRIEPYKNGKASDVIVISKARTTTSTIAHDIDWGGLDSYPPKPKTKTAFRPVTEDDVGKTVRVHGKDAELVHVLPEWVDNRFVVLYGNKVSECVEAAWIGEEVEDTGESEDGCECGTGDCNKLDSSLEEFNRLVKEGRLDEARELANRCFN